MSHQTGILATDELREFFAACKEGGANEGRYRAIKVSIENETLVLSDSGLADGTFEDDWDTLVLPMLEEKQPCYIFYRLDSRESHGGFEWLFLAYSPDHAHIREKMTYAATRATLKKEFGQSQIKEEVFGTTPEDISLAGYHKHLQAQNAPAPLTEAEEELKYIKQQELQMSCIQDSRFSYYNREMPPPVAPRPRMRGVSTHIHVETRQQTVQGVAFPIAQAAMAKLQQLKLGQIDYVRLELDMDRETIELSGAEDTTVQSLPQRVPEDHPRYHFFVFKHTHEGDYQESVVFIYSMPGYKCSIKERMLYSSCKAPLLDQTEHSIGITVSKKVEIDDGAELTEEFLMDELHPKKNAYREKFARPQGPAGKRGPRRMIRGANTPSS
ncbi:twinfilin-1-like isoform X1 [Branchiostoma floridae]|uniref:Twinfilin n=1 Tax=Branchiostoma floridae TaxID=7739 RepID=A0A9J7L7I0_BRAFL|nr:twinfilin-1-like isoform X1 [Branchiostoma floridae]